MTSGCVRGCDVNLRRIKVDKMSTKFPLGAFLRQQYSSRCVSACELTQNSNRATTFQSITEWCQRSNNHGVEHICSQRHMRCNVQWEFAGWSMQKQIVQKSNSSPENLFHWLQQLYGFSLVPQRGLNLLRNLSNSWWLAKEFTQYSFHLLLTTA